MKQIKNIKIYSYLGMSVSRFHPENLTRPGVEIIPIRKNLVKLSLLKKSLFLQRFYLCILLDLDWLKEYLTPNYLDALLQHCWPGSKDSSFSRVFIFSQILFYCCCCLLLPWIIILRIFCLLPIFFPKLDLASSRLESKLNQIYLCFFHKKFI